MIECVILIENLYVLDYVENLKCSKVFSHWFLLFSAILFVISGILLLAAVKLTNGQSNGYMIWDCLFFAQPIVYFILKLVLFILFNNISHTGSGKAIISQTSQC